MYYAYNYRLKPSDAHREELDRHRDICRQLYNHTLYRLNEYQDEHGELPSMITLRSELPDLKKWWDGLSDVYSKVLQTVVERLFDNLKSLSKRKGNSYSVGQLNWKPPREFRSFTYNQSGFSLDKKGGRLSSHSRNLRIYRFGFTALSPTFTRATALVQPIRNPRFLRTTPRLSRSHSKKSRRVSGSPPLASKWAESHLKRLRIPSNASVSTLGFASTPTTPTAQQSGRSTSPTSANAWNASSGHSRGSNTGRTTTRSNGDESRSVTPTSDGNAATSCTSSRRTTLGNTTSWRSKT